jgi:hypothetical protein
VAFDLALDLDRPFEANRPKGSPWTCRQTGEAKAKKIATAKSV